MTSKGVAELLSDLNIKRTHSRPHVSNDCDDVRVLLRSA